MSADNQQYYKLASVVDNFLIENDLGSGWFAKGLVWAIRGLRELSLDSFQDAKTALLDVTDRNSVVLPPGFVDWAVVSSYGSRPITLAVNGDISLIPPFEEIMDAQRATREQGYYLANFEGGRIFSYGAGSYTRGNFKVHDNGDCKMLLMDCPRYSRIYLEYITDGFDPCGETIIHPYIYDYLMKYMESQYEDKNNPKATESSKYRKGEDLFYAEKRVRARRNNLDPQTLLNMTRQYSVFGKLNA